MMNEILTLSAFLLVIINPISKVSVITALSPSHTSAELTSLSVRSTLVGMVLLVTFAFAGSFILTDVFRINLYSIQMVGGSAIFLMGMKALREGQFFQFPEGFSLKDMSAAPVGMPMIAGPATIAQVIASASSRSVWIASIAVLPALLANLGIMLLSVKFASWIRKTGFVGPLVRIVGIFVASIGAEMTLAGLGSWLEIYGIFPK